MRRFAGVAVAVMLVALLLCLCACSTEDYPEWAFDSLRQQDATRADGTDVRIMSVNMLVHMESWGGMPVPHRAQMADEFFAHYSPDAVALQELCGDWYKYLSDRIEGEYAFLHEGKTKTNIIYSADRLTVADSGYFEYSQKDNSGCRAVAWGVFETAEGERFALTSTHFDLGTEENKVRYRSSQIRELAAKMDEIVEEYGCPVFAAGDYNVLENEDYGEGSNYGDILSVTGAEYVKYSDGVRVVCDEGFVEEHSDNLWDHIFMEGVGATPLRFEIVTAPFFDESKGLAMTDHYPIFCDIALS